MAIQKEEVSIDVQDIIELLHSGYTWYKKDDLGYGSIQEKFNALDMHIKVIQKHPDLQNVDTVARVFVITNKNKNEGTSTAASANTEHEKSMGSIPRTEQRETREQSTISDNSVNDDAERTTEDTTVTEEQSADAFFNI